MEVLVFQPEEVGPGLACSTPEARHLLNVPTGGMSLFPDQPGHFAEWTLRNTSLLGH
ncbi:FAD/NAD(P)-binding protein [Roseomonas vastitatis]|uniref:FAD/NAD(P)-binding protein n=1 Tax=Teichococcus vastitatis TaxID=2307076 RepID=A0ABS9W750_9PROT|nr:FAD/NAD(P)-binding protein [Pseudoroseomonas vastitatis]MCI0755119.1 FAD/NAD(P)-binding protein [Pseudoroseomonas vastitatis]